MLLPLDDDASALLHRLPLDRPFTTEMAHLVGVSRKALHELVCRQALRRPVRTGYHWAGLEDTLDLRVSLLELIVPPGCFVADHTAAWLHAGDKALLPNAHLAVPKPDIYRRSGIRALRNPLVRSGERAALPRDLVKIGGLEVTTPLRTGCDLLRLFHRDVAMWGMCCMLGTGAFVLEQVFAEIPRYKGERGVVQMRALAPLADSLVQSFGEAGLLVRWHDAGLPRPRCQVPIVHGGRVIFWLDMGLEDLRFGAEYDGAEWHDGEEAREHDLERRGWLGEHRDWWIEVFRRTSVYGRLQDADVRLRAAYDAVRALRGNRTYFV